MSLSTMVGLIWLQAAEIDFSGPKVVFDSQAAASARAKMASVDWGCERLFPVT